MSTGKRDFDKKAATWDENPAHVQFARDVAQAVARQVKLSPDWNVMDFGCGTGLLTLELAPLVGSITGVDNSRGMLEVLAGKVARQNLTNVRTLYRDIDAGDVLEGHYDLIVSSMALHHIPRIGPLLEQFYRILTPGGHLCLADLDWDEGQFHSDNQGVFHFGFDRPALRRAFTAAGFAEVGDTTVAEVTRPDHEGQLRRFTIFLMTGHKKGMD